jgi:hypothetical protein
MAHIACTIKNITLCTVLNGSKYLGGIDSEGNELSDVPMTAEFVLADQRTYYCHNCKQTWDGSVSFEEVKKHFGTFPVDSH